MAKITAGGAREVARCTVTTAPNVQRIFVLCSDGRLLTRFADPGSPLKLYRRGILRPSRPVLLDVMRSLGYDVSEA